MKVIHITPTYFDNASIIGGGERYPTELALHMSRCVNTTLVSFSSRRKSFWQDNLRVEVYPVTSFLQNNKVNAFNFRYLGLLLNANIVHFHNINALTSVAGILSASVFRKRCFVTDYGGGSGLGDILNQKLSTLHLYQSAIAYSSFGLQKLPTQLNNKAALIKGGIDTDRFSPDYDKEKKKTILYVGRILPHKGINYLLEAFGLLNRRDYELKVIGRVYDQRFYQDLLQLSEGLHVKFIHDVDDDQLLQEYRQALVTVLPSVHTTCYGDYTSVPELMGFTLLESQACGTPVICTDAGAMPEFVDQDRTGFVVKQNSAEAIAFALLQLINLSPDEIRAYQARCRQWVQSLSWKTVVEKHLDIYQQ